MELSKIINKKIAIHCPTEAEADRVLQIMQDNGIVWIGGEPLQTDNEFSNYYEDTCYNLEKNGLGFSPVKWYNINKYKIIPAAEFIAANSPALIVTGGTVNNNHVLIVTGAEHPYDFNNLPA